MNAELYELLRTSAEADYAKGKLTLTLLSNNGVGVGEHSTKDFYDNAEEALALMKDAKDRLDMLRELKREI
jgi:hypothetical protein